jgi:hypothetical protein
MAVARACTPCIDLMRSAYATTILTIGCGIVTLRHHVGPYSGGGPMGSSGYLELLDVVSRYTPDGRLLESSFLNRF